MLQQPEQRCRFRSQQPLQPDHQSTQRSQVGFPVLEPVCEQRLFHIIHSSSRITHDIHQHIGLIAQQMN
jgi:hypothetical protein